MNGAIRDSVNAIDLGILAYESVREFSGRNLSDLDIAQGGYCMWVSPFVSTELSRILASIGCSDQVVFHESHSVLINVSSLTGDAATFSHEFTAVGSGQVPSVNDLVVDATYKQLLREEVAYRLPHVFLGTRIEAMDLMKSAAKKHWAHRLYGLTTLKVRRIS